jgi:YidC/Oxa1 family membrane protein insertase
LLQAPVFIGLFHVLRSFNRTGEGFGQLGLSPEENAQLGNYAFSPEDVQSFLSARLFGAPISAWITQPEASLVAFEPFGGIPSRLDIALVAIPLMIVAGIATHFNSRASVARQSAQAAANPQAAIMNKLALYVFPLGVIVGGPFLPIAILLYWVSNNIWTYAQQHIVFRKIDQEEEAKKQAAIARRSDNAPKPGARPDRTTKKKTASTGVEDAAGAPEVSLEKTATDDASGGATPSAPPSGSPKNAAGSKRPGGSKNSKRKRR